MAMIKQSNKKILKPKVKGGFSDRNKIEPISTKIQIDSFNEDTINAFINLNSQFFNISSGSYYGEIARFVYDHIFRETYDQVPYYKSDFLLIFKDMIKNYWNYDNILTYFETIVEYLYCKSSFRTSIRAQGFSFIDDINQLCEKYFIGYRMVDYKFIEVTNKLEVEAIEKAIKSPFSDSRISIKKAINHIYNREKTDYENGIKECISAVESACAEIVKNDKATLGKALNKLHSSGVEIHPSLKKAFHNLYGYTSDENGIRHHSGSSFNRKAEAQFMLVSCSAFISYLVEMI